MVFPPLIKKALAVSEEKIQEHLRMCWTNFPEPFELPGSSQTLAGAAPNFAIAEHAGRFCQDCRNYLNSFCCNEFRTETAFIEFSRFSHDSEFLTMFSEVLYMASFANMGTVFCLLQRYIPSWKLRLTAMLNLKSQFTPLALHDGIIISLLVLCMLLCFLPLPVQQDAQRILRRA